MRWRNWKIYGWPAQKLLVFPIIVAGRLLYYGVAKLFGRSVMWAHTYHLKENYRLTHNQQFIYRLIHETIP